MKKEVKTFLAGALAFSAMHAGGNTIVIDAAVDAGPVKLMNGINNGSVVPRGETVGNFDRGRSNFPYYKTDLPSDEVKSAWAKIKSVEKGGKK